MAGYYSGFLLLLLFRYIANYKINQIENKSRYIKRKSNIKRQEAAGYYINTV